jgi:site-specific recombinase XerD
MDRMRAATGREVVRSPQTRRGALRKNRSPRPPLASPQPPRLLDRLWFELRARHYSHRTEEAYRHWVKRFVVFHELRHPQDMGETEINAFLTHLAVEQKVSTSTQNQALAALLFLYRHVLGREVGDLGEVIRPKKHRPLPVVLTPQEVNAVLSALTGDKWLIAPNNPQYKDRSP